MPQASPPQPSASPLTLLLVSEHAEEIKQLTMTMRRFYPGSRVETVYTPEEALEWASKQNWSVIVLDEALPGRSGRSILPELRQRAPGSAILLQADRADTGSALEAMDAGADFILFKGSSTLLAELPLIVREVLEKRGLKAQLDLADRYRQLIEDLGDFVYELDPEGRFSYLSPGVMAALGYSPEELIGTHYSTLFQPSGIEAAAPRFDERRTGTRATRNAEVRAVAKTGSVREAEVLEVELATAGLYSVERRFLGSLGVARDITARKRNAEKLTRLQDIGAPLNSLLSETAQLMARLRELQFEQQLRAMGTHAARLAEVGKEVLEAFRPPVEEPPPQPTPAASEPSPAAEGIEPPPAPPMAEQSTAAPEPAPPEAASRPAAEPRPERRRHPRIDLEMDARLRADGPALEGRVVNMSLSGLYMLFSGSLPIPEDQPVQMGLGGEGGVLEIHGRIRAVRPQVDPQHESGEYTATGIAVAFGELGSVEARILASMLEGFRERAITAKLTVLLVPHDQEGLLVEAGASFSRDRAASPPAPEPMEPPVVTEHRMAARVNVVMPVSIAVPGASLNTPQGEAQTSNLSVGGACLRLDRPSDLAGRRILLRLSPPVKLFGSLAQEGTETASTVMGEVVWSGPDPGSPGGIRMGIRFLHLKEESRRRISALVGQLLTMPGRVEAWARESALVSDLLECRSLRGQRIVLYHDHARTPLPAAAPAVVLSPGYGQTKREYIDLAYALAVNGCHVFRYDHSHHVGESDGDLSQTTLSGMKDDLGAVLAQVERICPASPIAVVAADLSARVALNAAAQDPRIRLLIVLGGVVDLQATLMDVHHEDYIGTFAHGTQRGITNILGLNIEADRWLADASKQRYADLRTTLRDVGQIQIPVVWFVAEHDVWVQEQAVKEVHGALGTNLAGSYTIPGPISRLPNGTQATQQISEHIVRHCRERFYPLAREAAVQQPVPREVELQQRLENERARALHQMGTAESIEFWRDYLAQFHYIANFPDYWHLLEQVYGLVTGSDKQDRILDAGCGNGNFGMFLLINKAYRQQVGGPPAEPVCHYIGLDFVAGALAQTRCNLASVFDDLRGKFPAALESDPLLKTSLVLADLNVPLPFRSGQFGGIVCSLVLGYLPDPLFALRELLRVLAPKGRIVLTNLKPDADLTQIYRNFIPFARPSEEAEEAKKILATTGKLQRGQREGVFRSFDRHALARLLMSSGAVQPRIYSAFANQAFIVVAEKH